MPTVQVYTGLGSSHSWIWSAQCLDRLGLLRVSFADSRALLRSRPDALIFSGGDGFRMAEELGEDGMRRVRDFVSAGGRYIGICAGAYLALRSRSYPSKSLGLVRAPIANLAKDPPPNVALPGKYLFDCGGRWVFHPVRGEVLLNLNGARVVAPLFGGPSWKCVEGGEVFARYHGWAEGATLLAEEGAAREALVGKGAILSAGYGKGKVWLLGPHLEHPDHPDANRLFEGMVLDGKASDIAFPAAREGSEELVAVRRRLSEARVAYRGLEGASWTIGRKVWEHEKIGYFINAMWERVQEGESNGQRLTVPSTMEPELTGIVRAMRGIRRDLARGVDTTETAEAMFEALSSCASSFFEHYFDWRLRAMLARRRNG
ncbi:MAG: BPL-N domain-containing protein [Methanomassiliicoccales archaeon]|nr:BPL-N domain-containing protein [Methanomassiliicoccales archaeon]